MLKFNTLALVFTLFCSSLLAQVGTVDTVLWEDFETDPSLTWQLFPLGDDTIWVNYDADGLTPDGGLEEQKNWYWGDFFSASIDTLTGDTVVTGCLRSKSWMQNFLPGNRNWYITPPIDVEDGNTSYVLSWKSAPLQLPRYMDGYSVWVSTTSNDVISEPNPFDQMVFQAAQMTDITGTSTSIDPSNFEFSPGYLHADNVSNWEYLGLFTDGDSTLLTGLLEPHSVSLSEFAGQRIYIAFLHDSDDDNQMAIDDILVTKTPISSVTNPLELALRFRTYPNPVEQHLNVLYRLPETAEVSIQVHDLTGKLMYEQRSQQQTAGEYNLNLQLGKLPRGNYSVTLTVNGQSLSRVVTKR